MTRPEASIFITDQIIDPQLNIISSANHMGLLEYNQDYLKVLKGCLDRLRKFEALEIQIEI